ncbi:GntR family transcriptional regulator [Sphaerotilus sp.]|uniref:GntR family transcriptional regulator n=1 Tax=Sphaerotilus sp. TaxID=2093942 RepID=UPI0034E2E3DA
MPVPALPPFRLDRTRQATPQVFERLREAILTLELAPGTLLSRAELAASFGVSQTPVREALIKLGEEGLVDIFPQHATVVSRIGLTAARQAHFLRRAIELEVVATLAGQDAEAVATLVPVLHTLIAQQQQAMQAGDAAQFVRADRAFHEAMLAAAGVAELAELVRQRSGQVDRLRLLHLPAQGKMQAILADHARIVTAIAARDTSAAQQALRDHLSGTLLVADAIRQRHPGYITD